MRTLLEPVESRLLLSDSKVLPVDSPALVAGANINVSNQVGIEAEIGISVNPLNPLNIVATSNNVADLSRMATYFSTDGGTTWTTVFIDENQDGRGVNDTRFDPNVAFDSDGNVYVVYSLNTGTTSHLLLARSTDGGNTYAQVTEVTTDPANNNLHTAMVGTSPDGRIFHDVLDGATLADGTDVTVSEIQITDNFQATSRLPAQPDRGVWSTVTIDVDRSGGANDGRIYISYTSGPVQRPTTPISLSASPTTVAPIGAVPSKSTTTAAPQANFCPAWPWIRPPAMSTPHGVSVHRLTRVYPTEASPAPLNFCE